MAWRRQGDKPLSKKNMVSLLTHIYGFSQPQWVKYVHTQTKANSSQSTFIPRYIFAQNISKQIVGPLYISI